MPPLESAHSGQVAEAMDAGQKNVTMEQKEWRARDVFATCRAGASPAAPTTATSVRGLAERLLEYRGASTVVLE